MSQDGRTAWVTRFAPSPTGYLHLGHLVNAIYTWGIACTVGGEVILRLEDHDRGRCRPEYETAILDDLEWLGFVPDRGPIHEFRDGPSPFRQSDCDARYEAAISELAARGLIYSCGCSRAEIIQRTGVPLAELRYDGHCRERGLQPAAGAALRLRLPADEIVVEDRRLGTLRQCPARQCGDLLLRDRHGCWSYQFAVTVDDLVHGVNLVIRGEDLIDSTGRQVMVAKLLGRETPPVFLHHPLIAAPDGAKLSKRDFAKGLRDYRAEGRSAASVLGEAAWRVGLLPEGAVLEVEEIPALFEHVRMAQVLTHH